MRQIKVVVAFLVLATAALAQTTSGSITGSVVDPSRAAVPNVQVTAMERARNLTFATKSDESGRFVFAQVPPGNWMVTIEASGFKKYEQAGIVLNANEKLALGELTMQVGTMTEAIEVSATAAKLQTESAERGASLVSTQMQNIAVNSRSYWDLVKLVPGVVSTIDLRTAGTGGLANVAANGNRYNSNNATLNGLSNIDSGSNGGVNATVSLDSVQEYKILTGVYQAEYGRSMGAQVSVVTKSGTSQFHGSGYWYHRHDGLNANTWMNNRQPIGQGGNPRALFRFNDLGYTIGGPVLIPKLRTKDKLFFFWSQEFQRQLRPNTARNATLPTALERKGDFSQSVDNNGNSFVIKDPAANGTPFAGNVIPANRLYAPGVALLNFLPLPNISNSCAMAPGTSGCIKGYDYTSQISDSYPRREDLVRIDYNVTSRARIFGHYLQNDNTYNSYYGTWLAGSNIPVTPITVANPGYSWGVGNTYVFGPTMTNEFNMGASHNSFLIDSTTDAFTRKKTGVNLPVLYPGAVQNDWMPYVTFGGSRVANSVAFNTGNNGAAPFINYNTMIDIVDNVSKIVKQHTFKFGVYIQRSRKDQTSFGAFDGTYNFGDTSANPYDTNFGFSNAALGVYQTFSQAANFINGQYRYTNLEFFAQDTWKVTSRLTLDYGLRVAWYQPQYDASLQASTFVPSVWNASQQPRLYQPQMVNGVRSAVDPVTGQTLAAAFIGYMVPNTGNIANGIVQGGVNGASKYLQATAPPLWGPRLGIAWDVTGRQNVVIRTGAGMYYDRFQGNRVFDLVRNPPLGIQPQLVYGYMKDINPSSALLSPSSFYAADPTGKVPSNITYNFAVQTKLPYSFVLDTAYVGGLFRHLQDNRNLNYVPYGSMFLPQNQDPTLSTTAMLGSSSLPANFVRARRGIADIPLYESAAVGNYNSMQVTVDRRFGNLFFGIAYTWAKNLTTATGDTTYVRADQYTHQAYYGPSSNDRRQTFALNYVYSLPKLANANAIMRAILGKWQVSGVTMFQTGSPFNIGYSVTGVSQQNITGSSTEGARVYWLGNPMTGSSDPYNRMNGNLIAPPAVGSIGLESGNNRFTGPGTNNFDLSLQKEFSVKEKVHFQFRIDAFNVFNHTQFSGYNTSVSYASLTNWSPTNLYLKADGTVNNINGFGTVNGVRNARNLQTVLRIQF
jgi:hypothetical protein